ncbi:hypothetical protein H7J88_18970 [Mycolicibacterium flavescens]|uniref:Uncharacterized protein n=1 Tax=Mycolicibacterium flavescens TaxID=1776 RepID=A0A1E3RM87_MYCFV|nr:hypothetical protein [Mycolicibacterium flavescens]ODQ90964.1 hypothetical protein BHQ18_09245 [Mycolicibacterium flavescens]
MNLGLDGRAVVSVANDYTVRMKLTGGHFVSVESPFTLDDLALSPETDPVEAFTPVRQLVGQTIETATAADTGTLRVAFRNGTQLVVEPDAHYESWNLAKPNGALIVCTPGGELAHWKPDAGN